MQSDIKDLLKNEWAGSIQTLRVRRSRLKTIVGRAESRQNDEKAVLSSNGSTGPRWRA